MRDRTTREPLVPYAAAGQANAPMAELTAACLSRRLLPLVAGNRIHVTPPLTLTDDEARQGLAVLDEVLTIADGYTAAPPA